MKITAVRTYRRRCGYRTPVMVAIETDSGLVGHGEAGVAYGMGGTAACALLGEMAERVLLGADPGRVAPLRRDLTEASFWGKTGDPIFSSAISAIDQALLDLKGQHLEVPVHELLGGLEREVVPVYANGWWFGCSEPDEFAEAAAACVRDGYDALKFYPLAVPDELTVVRHPVRRSARREVIVRGIATIDAVRTAVGPDVEILLDLGGGLTTPEITAFCRAVERFDIGFAEEPTAPGTLDAQATLARATTIPLAAGERVHSRAGFAELVERGGVSVLQPDVCNCGGLMEAVTIAALGEVRNLSVSPHNYGGPLATIAAIHVSAAIPNLTRLEYFPYVDREPDYCDLAPGLPAVTTTPDGPALEVPAGPGLGVELDQALLAEGLVAEWT